MNLKILMKHRKKICQKLIHIENKQSKMNFYKARDLRMNKGKCKKKFK